MKMTLRAKLSIGYTVSMAVLLFGFVAADVAALQDDPEAWHHALVEHGLLALVVTVGIAIVSYYVVGRAFRPVHDIVLMARSISARDLSMRIEARNEGDELGELVETLNDMIGRLEVSFSQVARFSADAAHELKTPLAVLQGELDIALRKERSPEEYDSVLRGLRENVAGLTAIVDNLLFLARSGEPAVAAGFRSVALDEVALRGFEASAGRARARGVTLDLGEMDEARVVGDETLLQRMIANVLDNAVEHSPAESRVILSLVRGAGGVELRVEDAGCGIPPEHRERVFERFYRVDSSRSKKTGGAGLGLAIVRAIADLHGCEVDLRSEPGRGTSVAFRWGAEGLDARGGTS